MKIEERQIVTARTPEELSSRLWQFAARVGKGVDALPEIRLGRHVASRLVRCATAGAPNYDEERVAESRADFAHKLRIALKELQETRGWLRFVSTAELLPAARVEQLLDECEQLIKILSSSVLTATQATRARRASGNQQSAIVNLHSSISLP